jgi:hypothetical protein
MANRKRGALWVAALIVALIPAALQIAILVGLWLQFDSRLSCDRMIYWNEWLDCMHGQSHLHIVFAEVSVASWAVAGVVGTVGRFLPPYISFIFPAGMAVALALVLVGFWHEWYRPRTAPTLSFSDILNFTLAAGAVALISLGPSVSAWLLGLHKRTGRRAQLQLSTVFE